MQHFPMQKEEKIELISFDFTQSNLTLILFKSVVAGDIRHSGTRIDSLLRTLLSMQNFLYGQLSGFDLLI